MVNSMLLESHPRHSSRDCPALNMTGRPGQPLPTEMGAHCSYHIFF